MIDPRRNFPSTRLSSRCISTQKKKWSSLGKRRGIKIGERGEMKEKQAVKSREGRPGTESAEHRNSSGYRLTMMIFFFFFFSKYLLSISRIIETLDSSTLRMSVNFSSRYVRKKKKNGKKKEDKKERREEEWRGRGRKRGRKAKETAGGREERHNGANEKEEGGEKGWGSERKIDGGARCIRAFHFPCLSFPPLRQPDKGPSGTRSQVFTGPIRDERCQMENSRE